MEIYLLLWILYLQEVQQSQQDQEDQPHHGRPVKREVEMVSPGKTKIDSGDDFLSFFKKNIIVIFSGHWL